MNKYLVVLDGKNYVVEADSYREADTLRFWNLQGALVAVFNRFDAFIPMPQKAEPKQEGQADDK